MRNDIHSPKNIVPADYEYILSYSSGGDFEIPININEALKIKNENNFFPVDGNIWKCSICGHNFNDGDLWYHKKTDTYIAVGWKCAEKYISLVDRDEYRQLKAILLEEERKKEFRNGFIKKYNDLQDIFEDEELQNNYIIKDIVYRIEKGWNISDKQVNLLRKIKSENKNGIDSPEGKGINIEGQIIKVTEKFDEWSEKFIYKITVNVKEKSGEWFCYGTCPIVLMRKFYDRKNVDIEIEEYLKGIKIFFIADLKRGNQKNFSFFKRPRSTKMME